MRPRPHALYVILSLALAACGDRDEAAAPAEEVQQGGTVVVVSNSDLDMLNSLVTADRWTQEVNRKVLFLPLVDYGPELDYTPALAERWDMLGDTGAVFHLRRDVRWHDGTPTTAQDVVFTWERAVDPETAFPNSEYFANWTAVEAIDSFTVRARFNPHLEPFGGLPFLPIMPAHVLDSIPAARMRQAGFNRQPIGNGPFRFAEHRPGERWVFEANPDFPEALGGRPNIDRLIWRAIPEASAQVAEITAGSADVVLSPPSSQFAQLSQQAGLRGIVRMGRQYGSIAWNTKRAPLGDARVRRALGMAIDRQQIINTLRAGNGQVAVGPIGPYHWAYDESVQPLPFAPDSARAILDAAGIRDGNNDGIRELPNGQPFQIELKFPAGSEINRNMAEMIRANLADVGVRIEARPVDFATMIGDITGAQRNFDAVIVGWESDFRINLRDTYHSGALGTPNQVSSYSNARVDTLIDRAATVTRREQAQPIYTEIQRILRDEQPWSYLYYYPDLVLVRDRLRNVEMDVRGALVNVGEWWVTDPRPAPAAAPSGDSAARGRDPGTAPAP